MPHILFFRDYRGFTGGHLKVWHYFEHVRATPGFSASIRFSPRSTWENGNPWAGLRAQIEAEQREPKTPDVLFYAGVNDWPLGDADPDLAALPIINFVQSVRHSYPNDPRYQFLARPAIRICVSKEVSDSINATGRVNGPVFTILNAVDMGQLPPPLAPAEQDIDLVIAGLKNPPLARKIRTLVRPFARRIEVLTQALPRADYLNKIRRARVTLFLPHKVEGCYLPTLEGMALGTIVVSPNSIGNRSFCRDGINCLSPRHHPLFLAGAARKALGLGDEAAAAMRAAASHMAAQNTAEAERAAFQAILTRLDELWPGQKAVLEKPGS